VHRFTVAYFTEWSDSEEWTVDWTRLRLYTVVDSKVDHTPERNVQYNTIQLAHEVDCGLDRGLEWTTVARVGPELTVDRGLEWGQESTMKSELELTSGQEYQ